jgi:hypothetical protein
MKVFENRSLRKAFGSKRDEAIEEKGTFASGRTSQFLLHTKQQAG